MGTPSSGAMCIDTQYGSTPLVNTSCLDDVVVNNLARRRWQLMYTLLRNPDLIKSRKGYAPPTNNGADIATEIAHNTPEE